MLIPRIARDLWSWSPASEFGRLRSEVNRLLGEFGAERGEFPALNVHLATNDAVVTAELPGFDADKLDLTVIGDTLSITGSRETAKPAEGESMVRQERFSGHFSRSLQLPFKVDPDKVQATYKKGILTIRLPRTEEDRPKQISVKAG